MDTNHMTEDAVRRAFQRELPTIAVDSYGTYRAAAAARVRHAGPRRPQLRGLATALLALLLVVGLSETIALAQAPEGLPERIATIFRAFLGAPAGHVIATVNGRAITDERLDLEVQLRTAQGVVVTRAQVLDALIDDSVVLSEADRRGITVSDDELRTFIAEQKAMAATDPQRQFYRYTEALGVADADAWSYPPFVQGWREMLTYGALKRVVLGPVTQDTVAVKEIEWNAFVNGLRARADIRRFQ